MNNVRRVYIAHTINTVALSVITIYVPVYLLVSGYSLSRVITFFVLLHGVGLIFGLFVFPVLIKKWGLLNTFKLYYPLQVLYLFLLSILKIEHITPEIIAIVGGLSNFAYWIPMNIFLIKHSPEKEISVNLSRFFALPSLFGILGPAISAVLIPFIGFWPVFLITIIGLISSYIPLHKVDIDAESINFSLVAIVKRIKRNKTLLLFEFLDNIIEESEWFWSIYVFVLIGSVTTPGIIGSLEAVGGSIFTLIVGKYVNRFGNKIIPASAGILSILILFRLFIRTPFPAYVLTVMGAFVLTLFLVTYFSKVYKKVKGDDEVEFMIIREIPTVLGRMVVFGMLFLTLHTLKYFFLLPLAAVILLLLIYLWKGRKTFDEEVSEVTLGAK